MEPDATLFGPLIDSLESNARTSLQLSKLRIMEVLSSAVSKIILHLTLACIAVFLLLMLNIGIALWLGDLLGKLHYGFFILAGVYFLIGLIILFFFPSQIKSMVCRNFEKLINIT